MYLKHQSQVPQRPQQADTPVYIHLFFVFAVIIVMLVVMFIMCILGYEVGEVSW